MKKGLLYWTLSLLHLQLGAFEKLPSNCQVSYGNPQAPIQVVEYFSFSCPKCLDLFKKDFLAMKEKYINSQNVHWVFHLNPADLLTLQAIVCLEKLSLTEKRIFFEVIIDALQDPSEGYMAMQAAMEAFGKPLPELHDPEYLKKSPLFTSAYQYLKQDDVITELPTIEINGKLYENFPNRKFIEKHLSQLLARRTSS